MDGDAGARNEWTHLLFLNMIITWFIRIVQSASHTRRHSVTTIEVYNVIDSFYLYGDDSIYKDVYKNYNYPACTSVFVLLKDISLFTFTFSGLKLKTIIDFWLRISPTVWLIFFQYITGSTIFVSLTHTQIPESKIFKGTNINVVLCLCYSKL